MKLHISKSKPKKLTLITETNDSEKNLYSSPNNPLSNASFISSKKNINDQRNSRRTTFKIDNTAYFFTESSEKSVLKNESTTHRRKASHDTLSKKSTKLVKPLVLKEDLLKKVSERNQITKSPYNCLRDIKALLYKKKSNIRYQPPLIRKNKDKESINTKGTLSLTQTNDTFHTTDITKLRRGSDGSVVRFTKHFNNTVRLKEGFVKQNTISSHYLPRIGDLMNSEKELSKHKMELNAKKKTEKLLNAIENMIGGEYEDPEKESQSLFSYKNLSRVIELRKIQKGYNEDEVIDGKKKGTEKNKVKLAILKLGIPSFLKTSFKNSTIARYKNIKGLNFGGGRTKESDK